MPTWMIVLLVVIVVLAVGGFFARRAQLRRTRATFEARLLQADHDLAEAAASDRGWDREVLESAARRIYAEQRGAEPVDLQLVEVLDRPGTEEDYAVFQASHHRLTLGRRDGEWVLGKIE
jgi:Tfp pilus assembly protein PilX